MTVSRDGAEYERIAGILDMLPERVVRYRLPDLTISYCNAAWAAGHNLNPADVIGQTLDALLSEDEKVGLASQLAVLGPDNRHVADDVPRGAPNAPGEWVEWVVDAPIANTGPRRPHCGSGVSASLLVALV